MTTTDRRYGVAEGLGVKAPCRVATTGNISLAGLQTIDNITVVADDRVLVWQQTDATENGIWNASSGNWTRAVDFDGTRDVVKGTRVLVVQGDSYAGQDFYLTTTSPVIGTTDLDFSRITYFNLVTGTSDLLSAITKPALFTSAGSTYPNRYDIFPVECRASGTVRMSKSIARLFDDISQASPDTNVWVSNSGDDMGTGTEADPLETLQEGIAENVAPNVFVEPGTYDTFSFRTDLSSAGGVVKRVMNARSGSGRPVIITVAGLPVLSAATWTKTGGLTNVYETTLSLSGSEAPHRVVYTDRWDAWGFYDRPTKYSSTAALDAAGESGAGWYFDSGTGKLYIAFFRLNVETHKAKFRALYVDSSGNARIFLAGGVSIAFLGQPGDFLFDGITVKTLNLSNSVPVVGLENVTVQYANDHGIGVQGACIYSSGVRVHASLNDGFNYNPAVAPATPGTFAIEHNCFATMAGDITTFGAGSVHNFQGSSAHGGTNIIRAGGFYADNNSDNITDTTETGWDNYSWHVGVVTQNSAVDGRSGFRISFSVGGTRLAWFDTCSTISEDLSLYADGSATAITVKHVNCQFNVDPSTDGTAVISEYVRTSP